MKRVCGLLPIVVIGVLSVTMGANAGPLNPAIKAAVSQLEISAGMLQQNYVEEDSYHRVPTGYLDKEDGRISAIALDYGVVGPARTYAKLHFLYGWGETHYDGYMYSEADSGYTPHQTDTGNKLFDMRGNLGYMIGIGPRVTVAPQVEFGYTSWQRVVQGVGGSSEVYDSYRYGGGFEIDVAAADRWVFSLEGIYGRQHSHVDSALVDESLGNSSYTRLSAGVDYRLGEHMHLGLHAARVHYRFEQSDVSPSDYLEPASETTHLRVMASVGWSP